MSGENLPSTHEHSRCKSVWGRDGIQILKISEIKCTLDYTHG